MAGFISNALNSSRIINYFKGSDNSRSAWNKSIVFSVLDGAANAPCRLLRHIYKKWQAAFDASIFMRALRLAADNTHIAIGLLLFIMIIIPDRLWHNEYGVYMVLLLLALFALKTMIRGGTGFNPDSVDYTAILFFLGTLVAGITSLFPLESLNFLIFYAITFLAFAIAASSLDSTEKIGMLLRMISAGTFLTSLYGIYQWKIVGIPVNPSETDLALSQDLGGRVYSTMGNPNVYGELLVLTIPFFIALILNEKTPVKKILWGFTLAPVILVLFKTGSRAAWISFATSVLVFLFLRNRRLIPIFIIIGLVALPLLPAPIYNRILTIFNPYDKSKAYRMKIISTAVSVLKDYWVTGIGLGNTAAGLIFNRYKVSGLTTVAHTHVLFLQLWLESGLFAVLSFIAMLVRMARNTLVAMREKAEASVKNVAAASLSAIAGLIVMGFADHVWFYKRIMFMFWIVAAILFAALNLVVKHGGDAPGQENVKAVKKESAEETAA